MEALLAILTEYGIITAVVTILGGLLVLGIKKVRAKVAKSETKVDDVILEAVDKALEESKKTKK